MPSYEVPASLQTILSQEAKQCIREICFPFSKPTLQELKAGGIDVISILEDARSCQHDSLMLTKSLYFNHFVLVGRLTELPISCKTELGSGRKGSSR